MKNQNSSWLKTAGTDESVAQIFIVLRNLLNAVQQGLH